MNPPDRPIWCGSSAAAQRASRLAEYREQMELVVGFSTANGYAESNPWGLSCGTLLMARGSHYTVTHDVEGYTHSTATFARGGTHRYQLWRIWKPGPLCHFLMLNPSTADERQSDPTVTRCLNYAKAWRYGGLIVTNIFALRSTDPQQLYSHADPVGVENDRFILDAQARCAVTVAAWGNHGKHMGRGEQVRAMLEAPHMLGLNATGTPKHPLYLKADLRPVRWV